MSKHIRHTLTSVFCCAFLFGCTTVKLMKQEDFSIEKEKAGATPIEQTKPAQPPATAKMEPVSPLKGKTITLTANNTAFTDIFAAIADRAGLDLVIDSRLVAGTDSLQPENTPGDAGKDKQTSKGPIILPPVSIAFNKAPLQEALENVSSALHIFYQVNGHTLFVKGTESRTYHLNFLSSQKETTMSVGGDVISSSSSGTSSSSSGSSSGGISSGSTGTSGSNPLTGQFSIKDTIPATNSDICTQIEDQVKSSLTRDGTYSINRAMGFLEVNDRRDAIERIDAYIKNIKTFYNSQVLLTAKIIEVTLKDSSQYGIDWTSTHLSFNDIVFNPIQQSLAPSTTNLTPAFEIQAHSPEHGFDAAMNALEQYGDIKVLSNPRVRVTNGQPAMISVGTNTSFIQEIELTTTSTQGGTTITQPNVTIGSIFDGIMMGVVANIDLDNDSVNLTITPIKSRLEKLDERSISGNTYTLPTVGLEEASTQIRIKNGNIIALGGLISKNITQQNKSIPILGDIPFIGYIFSQQTKSVETDELVILLEPVILAQ
ncbi:MAG TPA: pilus (MSHA type) biogenesis protein MshL [Desulfomonilia bacterium]|nr:pilus (MSHA type) biogenesis protein MshL [Desulfomonilia bacterium]